MFRLRTINELHFVGHCIYLFTVIPSVFLTNKRFIYILTESKYGHDNLAYKKDYLLKHTLNTVIGNFFKNEIRIKT